MRMTPIFLFVCSPLLAFEAPPDEPAYTQPTFERPADITHGRNERDGGRDRQLEAVNQADFIVDRLKQIQRICNALNEEYRVDCLATSYSSLTNALRNIGGDPVVLQSLEGASAKLRTLAARNLDRTKPALRAHLTNPESGARILSTLSIRAVQTERLPTIRQQAVAVLDEAETVLLRSSTRSTEQSLLYQRVAEAVRSNKVLLRSA
jgi:hypothetical protein